MTLTFSACKALETIHINTKKKHKHIHFRAFLHNALPHITNGTLRSLELYEHLPRHCRHESPYQSQNLRTQPIPGMFKTYNGGFHPLVSPIQAQGFQIYLSQYVDGQANAFLITNCAHAEKRHRR
jgi:hypothetical protein